MGIMTLFAFSMPPATPKDIMAKLTMIATTIQRFAPQLDAVLPKVPSITSMFWPMANRSPLKAMKVYLNIQPMTQV